MVECIDMNNEKWDKIVQNFKDYDVYYLREYVKAFYLHGDGEPQLIFYKDENIEAMNVVMKRKINSKLLLSMGITDEYFDYSTPYGYGGILIQGNINDFTIDKFFEEYTNHCNKNKIVSEFIRFHPLLNNDEYLKSFCDVIPLGETISIPLTSKNEIWDNLVGKNRNVIRKALKNGVKIYWGRSKELYKQFMDMYNITMNKDNATDYYYFKEDFYKSVLEDLKYNSQIFYAVLDEKIIAMSIIMFCNESLHYHLSASNPKYLSLAPTNLLLYEVAVYGTNNGYKNFHLGGGLGSQEDSLFKFKRSFVKEYTPTHFSIGKKIYNQELYEKLAKGKKTNFFPAYR